MHAFMHHMCVCVCVCVFVCGDSGEEAVVDEDRQDKEEKKAVVEKIHPIG